jgi:hypothetical protein
MYDKNNGSGTRDPQPSPCIEAENKEKIIIDIRSDLYACTLGQIKEDESSIRHDLTNPPNPIDFIGMYINIPTYSESSPELHKGPTQLKCIHNKDNNASPSYCPDGYQFAYDDLKATSESYLGGYTDTSSPAWNVTLCPSSSIPIQYCPTPSSKPDDYHGKWKKTNVNEWIYKCDKDWYMDPNTTYSAKCKDATTFYTEPSPTKGTCIHTCATPSDDNHGTWKLNQVGNKNGPWHFDCDIYYTLESKGLPTPTAYCDPTKGIQIRPDRVPTCINNPNPKCPATPSSNEINGKWMTDNENKEQLHFHCNDKYEGSTPPYTAICTDGTWVVTPLGAPPSEWCKPIIDCEGEWSEWSICSPSCGPGPGPGKQKRQYDITAMAKNGGKACPDPTIKEKYCTIKPCPQEKCNAPSIPTHGEWITSDDINWFYTCKKQYYPSSTPSPSATCEGPNWNYIEPPPSEEFCHKCIPSPSWSQNDSNSWTYTCPSGKKLYNRPSATCDIIGNFKVDPNPSCTPIPDNHDNPDKKPTKDKDSSMPYSTGGGRKNTDDYYASPERSSLIGQEYASIEADYQTVEELNILIAEFYNQR